MAPEYWILISVAVAIVAAVAGFFGGRASAPNEQRVREMSQERDQARAEAEQVRGEVARHFDESARMFGRLAQDYRAFFEHFAETAQNLGMSEGRARELLHRADPRIVDASSQGTTESGEQRREESAAATTQSSDTADLDAEAERVARGGASEAAIQPDAGAGEAAASAEHAATSAEHAATEAGATGADTSAAETETSAAAAAGAGASSDSDEPKSEAERQRTARGDEA
jgi:uncharacterized membrane-anchored protein YhcB (DUF1043 family)